MRLTMIPFIVRGHEQPKEPEKETDILRDVERLRLFKSKHCQEQPEYQEKPWWM